MSASQGHLRSGQETGEREGERERENSNLKTLFYKHRSLGLSNN